MEKVTILTLCISIVACLLILAMMLADRVQDIRALRSLERDRRRK